MPTWPAGPLPAAVVAALLVAPVLAGWTVSLTPAAALVESRWWLPRRVHPGRCAALAALAAVLTVLAAPGQPGPAWWLWAIGGAVLIVLDVQTRRLPARLVYPLALTVGIMLAAAGDPARLARCAAAAALVGGLYWALRFACPPAMGMGDVRVAALAAALPAWHDWTTVGLAQLLTWLLAGITAIAAHLLAKRIGADHAGQVPMGPALITAPLLALWL